MVASKLKLPHPEEQFIRELRAFSGNLFIDVGAHAGWYTINLADRFREVWAIEPYHMYAEELHENLRKFNVDNVQVIEKALSDRVGEMPFYGNMYVIQGRDCPSLKPDLVLSYEGRPKQLPLHVGNVETTTLSHLVGDRMVDLVKVDVEGSELELLWGALTVMNQVRNWHIEVHDWRITPAIKSLLDFYGYEIRERGLDWRPYGWLLAWR